MAREERRTFQKPNFISKRSLHGTTCVLLPCVQAFLTKAIDLACLSIYFDLFDLASKVKLPLSMMFITIVVLRSPDWRMVFQIDNLTLYITV